MSVGAVNKQTGDRIPTAGMPAIDDALDLTSTNPVQNAIITAALANKQNATDNNLETTSKTVVGAVNELRSGLTNAQDNFTDVIGWGKRKNLYDGRVSADGAFATSYELPSGLTTITISAKKSSDCPQINTLIYDNEGNIIVNYTKLIDASNTSGHVTVTLNKQGYIAIYPISGGASNIDKVYDIQVEKGSIATTFEPFHPVIGPVVEDLESRIEAVESNVNGLRMIPITITDTVQTDSKLSDGVLLSDLTGGIITSSTQVKGLAMFNHRPVIVHWLCYQGKLIFAYDDTSEGGHSYTYKGVLFY